LEVGMGDRGDPPAFAFGWDREPVPDGGDGGACDCAATLVW
jgi:hypothetical protein